jgi:osmotically-inducible protein OsmY
MRFALCTGAMPAMKSAEHHAPTAAEPPPSARAGAVNPVSHDTVLRIRILDRLRAEPRLDASDVSVVVRNRSATLFGSVPDEPQRTLTQLLTADISGIIEVTNRLKTTVSKETT